MFDKILFVDDLGFIIILLEEKVFKTFLRARSKSLILHLGKPMFYKYVLCVSDRAGYCWIKIQE